MTTFVTRLLLAALTTLIFSFSAVAAEADERNKMTREGNIYPGYDKEGNLTKALYPFSGKFNIKHKDVETGEKVKAGCPGNKVALKIQNLKGAYEAVDKPVPLQALSPPSKKQSVLQAGAGIRLVLSEYTDFYEAEPTVGVVKGLAIAAGPNKEVSYVFTCGKDQVGQGVIKTGRALIDGASIYTEYVYDRQTGEYKEVTALHIWYETFAGQTPVDVQVTVDVWIVKEDGTKELVREDLPGTKDERFEELVIPVSEQDEFWTTVVIGVSDQYGFVGEYTALNGL